VGNNFNMASLEASLAKVELEIFHLLNGTDDDVDQFSPPEAPSPWTDAPYMDELVELLFENVAGTFAKVFEG